MTTKEELCRKIIDIYPDIGECGIDVDVDYDEPQGTWTVTLSKGARKQKTYLEPGDAALCMEGKQCVSLSVEISQLKDTIERMPREDLYGSSK